MKTLILDLENYEYKIISDILESKEKPDIGQLATIGEILILNLKR